jgi:hypothetical protein
MRSLESGAWSALVEATFVPKQKGDFNNDGSLETSDLDLLFAALRDGDASFDLTEDQHVDQWDVTYWLERLVVTERGDANLDRRIDFADFLLLSSNFGRDDAAWGDGDFNGDQQVNFADFLVLSENFGFDVEMAATHRNPLN